MDIKQELESAFGAAMIFAFVAFMVVISAIW